jgi:hypothetical protein
VNDEGNFNSEAMPTQGGTYSAWVPEYQDKTDERTPDGWLQVPMRRSDQGIPGAPYYDGLNLTIGMCSFAQANAIAWSHAAAVEAQTGKTVPVRVVEYRVKYDIKCYRALPAEAPHDR